MFDIKRLSPIIIALVIQMIGFNAPEPVHANDFDFYMDYARFNGSQGFGYLEVYFGIPRDRLHFEAVDSAFQAQFQIQIDVYQTDSLISSQTWQNQDQVNFLDAIQSGQTLQDVKGLYLKPGNYAIHALVHDLSNRNQKEKIVDVEIAIDDETKLSMSDIQLALYIKKDTDESKFVKNGYRILPNPGRVYTSAGPILYYYLEIYGLSPLNDGIDSSYTVSIELQNDQGQRVRKMADKKKIRNASSLVEMGNMHVGALKTAAYSLNVGVVDHASNDSVSSRILFYVYRQQDLVQMQDSEINEDYGKDIECLSMDESSLNQHFEYVKYIATRNETKAYKKLDVQGKRMFMQEFWRKRDTNEMTIQNEFKDEYYTKINITKQQFSTPNREGWKTDRGRVLIIYGEPDDIKRYTFGSWGRPYEVWQYFKVEGGVEFIFADESGYGQYILIHSTATNQIHDFEWLSRLN